MFFANEMKTQISEEHPDLIFDQDGKFLGNRWQALSKTQRAPYIDKAELDEKRYKEEIAKYYAWTPGYEVDEETSA